MGGVTNYVSDLCIRRIIIPSLAFGTFFLNDRHNTYVTGKVKQERELELVAPKTLPMRLPVNYHKLLWPFDHVS